MHTTGYAGVTHSLADSTVPKECTKYLDTEAFVPGRYISGICPSVHSVRHLKMQSCSVQHTVLVLSQLLECLQPCHMVFYHGSSHLGFCHIWRQPSCQHGRPSCKMHFTSNNKLSNYLTKYS